MYYTKKQIGGKKIGKGGISCVIKPAISCNKTKKMAPNFISKIMRKQGFTNNYKKVNEKLKEIDNKQKYYRYFSEKCLLNNTLIKSRPYKDIKIINKFIANNNIISNLDIFDDLQCEIEKNTSYINIIEKYGGDSLYKILQFKTLNITNKLEEIITNLLEGLELLHKNKIVHRDIKIDNITINNKFKATYIDFNNSYISNNINKISVIGNYSYNISIDYLIFFYLYVLIETKKYKFNKKLVLLISKLCNKKIKNSIKTLSDINISLTSLISFNTKTDTIINNSKYEYIEYKFDKLIKLIYKKFSKLSNPISYFKNDLVFKNDVYGLGIVFKIIYNKLINGNMQTNINKDKFNKLINGMTNINPDKRLTAKESLDLWQKK
jgi:serine/threonine protein kinase